MTACLNLRHPLLKSVRQFLVVHLPPQHLEKTTISKTSKLILNGSANRKKTISCLLYKRCFLSSVTYRNFFQALRTFRTGHDRLTACLNLRHPLLKAVRQFLAVHLPPQHLEGFSRSSSPSSAAAAALASRSGVGIRRPSRSYSLYLSGESDQKIFPGNLYFLSNCVKLIFCRSSCSPKSANWKLP